MVALAIETLQVALATSGAPFTRLLCTLMLLHIPLSIPETLALGSSVLERSAASSVGPETGAGTVWIGFQEDDAEPRRARRLFSPLLSAAM